MIAIDSLVDEITDLKVSRKAVILAHHYQDAEIQDLADAVGDSLELARKAQEFSGDVIAFCGVWFMAETAKVLNPERIVVVPDRDADAVWSIAARWSRFARSRSSIRNMRLFPTSTRRLR